MMPTVSSIWVVALWLAATPAPESAAEDNHADTLNQVVELNKRALLAYDALEMESASSLLHQALNLCKTHGLDLHPAAARTHLHLGVVYISGLKFPELGETELRQALSIDPTIQLPTSLVNPEVQAAFDEALWWETAPKDLSKRIPFPTGQEPPEAAEPETAPGVDRIRHPLVTQATRGKAIEIKAQIPPGMGAAKVLLAYMAQNGSEFLAREMTPLAGAPGYVHASIPVEATQGGWVAYYLAAHDEEDEPIAHHGSAETPHPITLVPEGGALEAPPAEASGKTKARGAAGSGIWVVLALGTGGGYHHATPEMNPRDSDGKALHISGMGLAQLMHVAPEIGYFHHNQLVFSAQGRFQYVTGTQDIRIGRRTYRPAAMAFAGLVKATWLFTRPGSRFLPFVNLQAGGGQIRHTVTTPASVSLSGCGTDTTRCKDTARGGPALVGVGAGFGYRVSHGLGLYAACNLLVGFPDVLVNSDLNFGVLFTP
jgi:hypothetical protein